MGEVNVKPVISPVSTNQPVPPESGPGDFTRLFRGASAPSGAAGMPQGPAEKGEFTQIFGGGMENPPPSYATSPGEFTSILSSPPEKTPIAARSDPQPVSAPGEYTRMFRAQPSMPVEEPVPSPAPSPVPESSFTTRQNPKLVPVLIGIIVLLLIVIVFLLIKK
jgi:hypothetical protein